MKRIGIFGGTFNPVHIGHIRIANEARKKLRLNKVVFVPTGIPPHKSKRDICSSIHRIKMIKLAIKKNKYFEVSTTEAINNKKSYSIETINKFRRKYGRNTKLFFILGMDAMSEISTWKNPDKVIKLCKFVCLTRPGHSVKRLKAKLIKDGFVLNRDFKYIKVGALKIASSEIRNRIKINLNVKNMLSVEVMKYIEKNGLYIRSKNKKKNKKSAHRR